MILVLATSHSQASEDPSASELRTSRVQIVRLLLLCNQQPTKLTTERSEVCESRYFRAVHAFIGCHHRYRQSIPDRAAAKVSCKSQQEASHHQEKFSGWQPTQNHMASMVTEPSPRMLVQPCLAMTFALRDPDLAARKLHLFPTISAVPQAYSVRESLLAT